MTIFEKEMLLQNQLDKYLTEDNDAIAIKEADRIISYSELTSLVNSIAGTLRHHGIIKGDAIPIYATRSIEVVASILAIIKVGGYYVPISSDIPPVRVEFICRDIGAKLLMTDNSTEEKCGIIKWLSRLQIDVPLPRETSNTIQVNITNDDIAYVIYTSGTTGYPKGVIIEHGSIARRFFDWDKRFKLTQKPLSILQASNLGFDVFTGDWVKALCSGGRLVLCDFERLVNPKSLFTMIVDENIDYVDLVPSVVRILVDYIEQLGCDLHSLSVLNCGSDRWTIEEYFRFKSILKVPHLVNGYGVTECCIESFIYEEDDNGLVNKSVLPIGKPLASDSFIIVDHELNPVEQNVRGEICIGGPCIARGYINRPELDRDKFIFLKNGTAEPGRYYRTGDIGLLALDGNVDFFGRIDYQVKLHGRRIELHEIESQLEMQPSIKEAVVFIDYKKSVVIAVIQKSNQCELNKKKLSSTLMSELPKYMIPSDFIEINKFPLTGNGKVDRQALIEYYENGFNN